MSVYQACAVSRLLTRRRFPFLVALLAALWGSAALAKPTIDFFRVVSVEIGGEQWYEFHWKVEGASRVRLFEDSRELESRIQLPDGSFGWPPSMNGSYRTKPSRSHRYQLVAEDARGASVTRRASVSVAERRPDPVIKSFRVSPDRVRPGDFVKFFWEVENARNIRLFDDKGEVPQRGGWDLVERGTSSISVSRTTTYRLIASAPGRRSVEREFTVRVAAPETAGRCTVRGKLSGKWRQWIQQRPNGPREQWTVDVLMFRSGERSAFAHARVRDDGTYVFENIPAGGSYVISTSWGSRPGRRSFASCQRGRTVGGGNFIIVGGPLID